MRCSVIIPALNEEKLLPQLLESLRTQSFEGYEIIVADADSGDRTAEVARSYGARVVPGGLPSAGRNAGAAAARGEYLFFLDADVLVPEQFLHNVYQEMRERSIELATCEFRPISDLALDWAIHRFLNFNIRTFMKFSPKAFGFCIFCTRGLFDQAGGFNESILFAEDSEFVERASRLQRLRWLESTYVRVSVRRFEKEGRLGCMKKLTRLNLRRMLIGELDKEKIDYTFGDYENPPQAYERTLLGRIERLILRGEARRSKRLSAKALEQSTTDAGAGS